MCLVSKDSAYCWNACRNVALPSALESVFASQTGFSSCKKVCLKIKALGCMTSHTVYVMLACKGIR